VAEERDPERAKEKIKSLMRSGQDPELARIYGLPRPADLIALANRVWVSMEELRAALPPDPPDEIVRVTERPAAGTVNAAEAPTTAPDVCDQNRSHHTAAAVIDRDRPEASPIEGEFRTGDPVSAIGAAPVGPDTSGEGQSNQARSFDIHGKAEKDDESRENETIDQFLRRVLAAAPVSVREIERMAISARLLAKDQTIGDAKRFRSARNRLGIIPYQPHGLKTPSWVWALPETASGSETWETQHKKTSRRSSKKKRRGPKR
jgi:hypothetical protein